MLVDPRGVKGSSCRRTIAASAPWPHRKAQGLFKGAELAWGK